MNLIQESYQRLFPDKEFSYQTELEYNRRLGDFNANITLVRHTIKVNLNLQWKDIDEEIKIGLIQHLLLKIFKKKIAIQKTDTQNINLYNSFVKNIPLLTPKTKTDPALELSFKRVNEKFFEYGLEKPNLKWGTDSYRKLASYNFHNDTVTISTLFKDTNEEIIDYLMYHELLHKHHKFKHRDGRSAFHTREFRKDEKNYPHYEDLEKKLKIIIRSKRNKNIFLNPKKSKNKFSLWNFFG